MSEIQSLKNRESDGVDPSELNSLKKRIAKLEADLRDKSDAANRYSTELDQLRTASEELKRRASVGPADPDLR